jgi:hypothetical protein
LHVEKCLIKNFTATSSGNGNGILFAPSAAATLYVSETLVVNNGGASNGGGIIVKPTGAGATKVVVENVQVLNSNSGIVLDASAGTGGISGGIRHTVVGGGKGTGFVFNSIPGAGTVLAMLDRVASYANAGNGFLSSGSTSTMLLGNSSGSGNTLLGLATSNSGALLSYGDNQIAGNFGGDGSATGPLGPH